VEHEDGGEIPRRCFRMDAVLSAKHCLESSSEFVAIEALLLLDDR